MSDAKKMAPESSTHTKSQFSLILVYRSLLVLGVLMLVLVGFAFTPLGAKLALNSADSMLEELTIDYQSGGLGSELHLSKLDWQQEGVQLSVQNIQLSIDLTCVWHLALCFDSISTTETVVNIQTTDSSNTQKTHQKVLTLPFPISVQKLHFENVSLDIKDNLTLSWKLLQGQLHFQQKLQIDNAKLQGVSLATHTIPATGGQTQTSSIDWVKWQYKPLQPTPISLPIHFDVSAFDMTDIKLYLAGQSPVELSQLRLKGKGDGKAIELDELFIEHQIGSIQANGSMQLNGDFEHVLFVKAQGQIPSDIPLTLDLSSAGNMHSMTTEFKLTDSRLKGINNNEPALLSGQLTASLTDSTLPLKSSLRWQNIVWPLAKHKFESAQGNLELSGNLDKLNVSLNTSLKEQALPEIQIKLESWAVLSAKTKSVKIDSFTLEGLDGAVVSKGEAQFSKWFEWQGNTVISHVNPGVFWPEIKADISGEIPSKVSYRNGLWQVSIDELAVNGQWQEYPLTANGSIEFEQNSGLQIQNLLVTNAENKLLLTGMVDQQKKLDVNFSLDAPELSNSLPNYTGALYFEGNVQGTTLQPDVSYELSASDIGFSNIRIEELIGKGNLKWDEQKPLDLAFELIGVQGVNNQVESAKLTLAGNAKNHQLSISAIGQSTDINLQMLGHLSSSAWRGKWTAGDITSSYANLNLTHAFDIEADWGSQQYVIAPHCWSQEGGELCFKRAEFKQDVAIFDLSLKEFNPLPIILSVTPSMPNAQTSSRLNLNLSGSWNINALPEVKLTATLSPGDVIFPEQDDFQLAIQKLSIDVLTNAQNVQADVNFNSNEVGQINAKLQTPSSVFKQPLNRPIDGELVIKNFDLSSLNILVPQLDILKGQINGQASIEGILNKPLLIGKLALINGELKGESLPVSLSDIQQQINLNGQSADFEGSYRLGNGIGQLTGQLIWEPELKGNMNISGDALEFDYQSLVKAKVSPNINVLFEPNSVVVNGEVSVPYARVKVRELPKGVISPSKDVVLIEQQQLNQTSEKILTLDLLLNIDPLENNDVKLDAFGLTTDLQGQLSLQNGNTELLGNGEVQLVNGRYRAYGQNLVIREGDILFSGSLDGPYLNIEAVRDPALTEDDVVAGLRVEGGVESPDVTVFSEPNMEQQQSLSYMLTGRGLGEESSDSQNTILTNALLSLGLGQSENLVNKVGDKLGFEDVVLDTSGQGDNTQLSLSGNVAPGVQLRYGVGVFDSASEVAIRYELLPKLYLEAVSGLNNAIDIYYQFSVKDKSSDEAKRD